MFNLTPLLRPGFARVARQALSADNPAATRAAQEGVLRRLLHTAADTEAGHRHHFSSITGYEGYALRVPVTDYAGIRHDVERMVAGERDVLWPGVCRRFAQSSGTSDGKSKYIPVTADSLRLNHYAGGAAVVAAYLAMRPDSRLFAGKAFILGGSFANELHGLPDGVRVGDLSANLIEAMNPAANLLRIPSRKIALMPDWREKLPALVQASLRQDITNISGVPSWFLTVLREVIAAAGASTIHDVWPNLEVFFHGGIAFGPYRSQYDAITDPSRMHYVETYNASEGFFAVQDDPECHAMRLLTGSGVFYEFVPLDEVGSPTPHALPAWGVEPGHTYAMIISSCNGLWRYAIGDTVRIESVEPLRITIAGRTRSFINAFGEEVMVYNTDAALAAACAATGASALNYTAAPVFADGGRRGRHQWLVEWATPPADRNAFAELLDRELQHQNSDYQAKRAGNLFLDPIEIIDARPGLFDQWLESTGKLGGQRKVPRLNNDRKIIDKMLEINNLNHTA